MVLHASPRRCFSAALTLLTLLVPGRMFAVSCKTQAQMTEPERSALVQAAKTLATDVQSEQCRGRQGIDHSQRRSPV